MNMPYANALERTGESVRVYELAVHDKAHVHLSWFCSNGDLLLLATAEVQEPSKYSNMAKVTVLPGRQVDVTLVPANDKTTEDAIGDALQN